MDTIAPLVIDLTCDSPANPIIDLTCDSPTNPIIDLTCDSPTNPNNPIIDLTNDTNLRRVPQWINVRKWKQTPPLKWMGLDRGDGRYRLYQKMPKHHKRRRSQRHKRGWLMSSFSKEDLLIIAWEIGVFNPDGFGKSDCRFWGVTSKQGFKLFLIGWEPSDKNTIIQYMWNTLEENDEILFC